MQVMKYICVALALGMWFTIAIAQPAAPAQNAPSVKHVPIKNTPSNDGKEMYDNYCAVCHGKDGKGTGPAAPSMKTSPTDLTGLAKTMAGNTRHRTSPQSFADRRPRLPTATRTCQFGDRCSPASVRAMRPECNNG